MLIRFVTRLLVAAYLVEAGLVLIVAPWTAFWERNFFSYQLPIVGGWMANAYVRGAVTGVGVITALGGLRDLTGSILARPAPTPPPPPGGPDSRRVEP